MARAINFAIIFSTLVSLYTLSRSSFFSPVPCGQRKNKRFCSAFARFRLALCSPYVHSCERLNVIVVVAYTPIYATPLRSISSWLCETATEKTLYSFRFVSAHRNMPGARFHTHTHTVAPILNILVRCQPTGVLEPYHSATQRQCIHRGFVSAQCRARLCVCCVADCGEFRDALWSCLFSLHTLFRVVILRFGRVHAMLDIWSSSSMCWWPASFSCRWCVDGCARAGIVVRRRIDSRVK